ncbi:MAG: hypothetical protein QOG23_3839 [Blastocatellia bacterium]|nr:hypothetical protein [Blastocatellia bacterium]
MIMLSRVAKLENDRYLGIKAFNLTGRKIPGRIEYQPVNTGRQHRFFRNQIRNPAILVSGRFADQLPAARCFDFQGDRHPCGRPPF